ncbi:MAG: FAD-binding oxidoreductase [Rhizobiaceae bacterium]|nr:FAD-binding oxidoreductase [Rhizobiaceae bacterium]
MNASGDVESRLRRALPDAGQNILFGAEIPVRHHADWTRLPPVVPLALVRPADAREVSAVLRVCNETATPVVTQGGLTGLVGGAHPVAGCVALSLDRLTGIEEIDVAGATMIVRAGTPLEQAQAAAEAAGFMLPIDLGARGSCSIGGNLATNAGGNRVIRYGSTRDHVLGLEAVLPDGTIVDSMSRLVKNNTGYDLKQFFIGSEGTLGVITRAVLRLQPRPAVVISAMCAVAGFDELMALLGALRGRLGPSLSAFEAMWPDFWNLMVSKLDLRAPFASPHGAYALVEVSGFDPERDPERLQGVLSELLETGVLEDATIAQTSREAADFWKIREGVSEIRRAIGPIVSFDVGLPAASSDEFVRRSETVVRGRWPDAIHVAYGHLGDCNIHIIIQIPSAGAHQPKGEIDDLVYGVVREFGGSISAEHGIGLSKRKYLPLSRSPAEIAMMRSIKAALDPRGIMNPGKLFPS